MSYVYTFGFIGCGNMGGALVCAAAKNNPEMKIAVCDKNAEKTDMLSSEYGNVSAVELKEAAQKSKYLFIGVKPQMLNELFVELREELYERDDVIIVSMAAGTPIEKITALAGKEIPVIRIMPNIPVSVGKGVVLYSANCKVTAEELDFFVSAMSGAGFLDAIDEAKIDAASAISGCGPAFVYMFIEALADGGVECGLPRDKAMRYAAAMLAGAADMVLLSGKHPGELKDSVCSPGGTTIAGVHALEMHAFRAAGADAVNSAYKRTLELKK